MEGPGNVDALTKEPKNAWNIVRCMEYRTMNDPPRMRIEVERLAIGQRRRDVWTLSVDLFPVRSMICATVDHWEPRER